MAQGWKPFEKTIRDKIVSLLVARAEADGVQVKEILNHLHAERQKFESNGIYVINPGFDRDTQATMLLEGWLRYPVICNSLAFTEDEHKDVLADLVGLVWDTVQADATMGGLVEEIAVERIEALELSVPGGTEAYAVTQQVDVAVRVAREAL